LLCESIARIRNNIPSLVKSISVYGQSASKLGFEVKKDQRLSGGGPVFNRSKI
jgi:hypothetical protein